MIDYNGCLKKVVKTPVTEKLFAACIGSLNASNLKLCLEAARHFVIYFVRYNFVVFFSTGKNAYRTGR